MVLGLSVATYTLIHVVIRLAGIVFGLVVMYGLLTANPMKGWTAVFLITTVLTSVTGFGFPFMGVTPAIILGALSLIVLAAAIVALSAGHGGNLAQSICDQRQRRALLQSICVGCAIV